MATVSKFKLRDQERPAPVNGRLVVFTREIDVVSGDCPQNDNIDLFDLPANYQVLTGHMRVSASLGASATATLRAGTTAITAATAAGGADVEALSVNVAFSSSEQSINILIEGAAITASATFRVILIAVDCNNLA